MATFFTPSDEQPMPAATWMPLDDLRQSITDLVAQTDHPLIFRAAGSCLLALGDEQLASTSYRSHQTHRRVWWFVATDLSEVLVRLNAAVGHWREAQRRIEQVMMEVIPSVGVIPPAYQQVALLSPRVQEHLCALLALTLRVQIEYGDAFARALAQQEPQQQKGVTPA